MHDIIRATHDRRRGYVVIASALAASVVAASITLTMPRTLFAAASTASVDQLSTAFPIPTDTTHEIRRERVRSGHESLELSAKLTVDGGLIQRPIAWKLHRLGGETVFSGSMAAVTVGAEPGDYIIEASYGSVRVGQSVSLLKGQRVGLTLILNVGGIRVLSRLSGIGLPASRPLTTVYSTSGLDQGKLITISEEPGEIVRLAAGSYRIESRFASGNATATANVTVKPGLLSSIEIDHHAGIAYFSPIDGGARMNWTVRDGEGHEYPVSEAGEVILMPGRYVARATSGGESRIVPFTIEAGKRIAVAAP